jgi:hypothetical protein
MQENQNVTMPSKDEKEGTILHYQPAAAKPQLKKFKPNDFYQSQNTSQNLLTLKP